MTKVTPIFGVQLNLHKYSFDTPPKPIFLTHRGDCTKLLMERYALTLIIFQKS